MPDADVLDLFLPPVREWFRTALGAPTAAQRQGWPAIVAGQNTLILAPTGSGKTLAAFLACLDSLWRQNPIAPGIQVLYVSPLKALNNDIYRNLQVPLEGVAEFADRLKHPLPKIGMAVRTGDTPQTERQRLLRKPPHVLITTPESLHLLLTSRAREALRNVRYCIIDEIHALCPNKRGVFLAFLLERLEASNPRSFLRIGLSATQRPLEEVARYLGGLEKTSEVSRTSEVSPRPVTIVDAGMRKGLDLRVVSPVEQFGPLPEKTIWPSIYRLLADEIGRHRSTIVFANNRRSVERITANLNDQESGVGSQESGVRNQLSGENVGFLTPDSCLLTPVPLVRAHHGSVALEVRQETEQALKEGRLRGVVATASLELGIDMGAVELVCQVESPGNVARGLQRVGRAGHLVGKESKGRLIPKTLGDLLEQAVLAAEMAAGRVEELRVPSNCLDVLAQQVVAMVAMEDWDVSELYSLVRRAYPFRSLPPQAFETVLEMISGRYQWPAANSQPATDNGQLATDHWPLATRHAPAMLQARISWDRVHNRLHALPGSQRLAVVGGGTIPDTGQYGVYTGNGVRLGELDEEFVYERRVGDTFLLGTNSWRLEEIQADRVLVTPASGAPAMVPFWRGEQTGRSYHLGLAMGRFLRALASTIDQEDCLAWLEQNYFLDPAAARNLRYHVRRQLLRTGCVPSDLTVVIEASRDQLGDWQVIFLSPMGSRFHFSLRLAIENRLRDRLGYRPQCLHHDDGILIRLADADEPVLDILEGLTPENVRGLILDELADSALFALRFRQNASRALLLPRAGAGKRAPLWLQRLRGRDLLQMARRQPDFPIVAETLRECLHDHLEVSHLEQFLTDIQAGAIQVVTRRMETASPFAAGLLFAFTAAYMYQYDGREGEPTGTVFRLDPHLLDQLVKPESFQHLLDPRAVNQLERRLRGLGQPPRSATEMAEWLRRLGDLTERELEGSMAGFLTELENDGRAKKIKLPVNREPVRWVLFDEAGLYDRVFGTAEASSEERQTGGETILQRFLETHALVSLHDVLERYPFEVGWAKNKLEEWSRSGRVRVVPPRDEGEPLQWSAPANLDQVQRGSLAILRREVITCPAHQFADFVLRWQGLYPGQNPETNPADVLEKRMACLQALLVPAELWEEAILPARIPAYQPRWLDDLVGSGQWTWFCRGDQGAGNLAFVQRDTINKLPPPPTPEHVDPACDQILDCLRGKGAQFVPDLATHSGLSPGTVRSALWDLLRQGLVSNDHFDVIRKGEATAQPRSRAPLRRPEGRWSLLPWARPDTETQALFLVGVLLERYGIVSRELALLDGLMPPWRILYEVLSRLELAGKVRRGYFVEGMSGAQFALPEAARMLQELSLPSTVSFPVVFVHSLDPANLYGSSGPFDIAGADGEPRPFTRRSGNWLILRAGKPILVIENQGHRLSALAGTRKEDIAAAVACLPAILGRDKSLDVRRKLTVDEWNDQPVTATEGREYLEAAGFVRDYQSMTLYGVWR
jgi:ATP-dependent Lhr-like helicase